MKSDSISRHGHALESLGLETPHQLSLHNTRRTPSHNQPFHPSPRPFYTLHQRNRLCAGSSTTRHSIATWKSSATGPEPISTTITYQTGRHSERQPKEIIDRTASVGASARGRCRWGSKRRIDQSTGRADPLLSSAKASQQLIDLRAVEGSRTSAIDVV